MREGSSQSRSDSGIGRRRGRSFAIIQWAGSVIGLLVVVKISCIALPFEGLGYYLGTIFAVAQPRKSRPVTGLAESLRQPVDFDSLVTATTNQDTFRTWS